MTAGLTVAVLQIPQGMAYGILAGVAANVGLYMAFFHSLVYAVFGTSRHISMGTFAVTSLMTAKIVATYSTVIPTLAVRISFNASNVFVYQLINQFNYNSSPMELMYQCQI